MVEEAIYDEFVEKVAARANKSSVGNPMDLNTDHGAQIDLEQFNKINSYIDAGKKEGAKLVTGGERVGDKGYFIAVKNNKSSSIFWESEKKFMEF